MEDMDVCNERLRGSTIAGRANMMNMGDRFVEAYEPDVVYRTDT